MSVVDQFNQELSEFWSQRTAQERQFLSIGGFCVGVTLIYLLLIAPALQGRAQYEKAMPDLRAQVAAMQALVKEAQGFLNQPPANIQPLTKESLETLLNQRGLPPTNIALTSEFVKVQLVNVQFANLITFLGEIQKIQRVSVLDAAIVSQDTVGSVNATLTLKQITP
jgi:general secretion pathway protein M